MDEGGIDCYSFRGAQHFRYRSFCTGAIQSLYNPPLSIVDGLYLFGGVSWSTSYEREGNEIAEIKDKVFRGLRKLSRLRSANVSTKHLRYYDGDGFSCHTLIAGDQIILPLLYAKTRFRMYHLLAKGRGWKFVMGLQRNRDNRIRSPLSPPGGLLREAYAPQKQHTPAPQR